MTTFTTPYLSLNEIKQYAKQLPPECGGAYTLGQYDGKVTYATNIGTFVVVDGKLEKILHQPEGRK